MMKKMAALVVGVIAVMAVGASTASAASGCVDGKLKALGKKESSLLKCQAKNAAKPDTVKLADCESKASGKFGPACSAAGVCSGDCTTCENNADACETNVSAAITDAATLKAASKLVKGELKCYTKAAAKSVPVDTVKCLPKAQGKFAAAGGTAGEQNTIETDCVDNNVTTDGGGSPPTGNVTAICGGGGGGTTTTTTTSPGGSTTTTTIGGPMSLKFSNTAGTTSCGGAGLSPGPSCSPVACSGELDSDTACSTKVVDLGEGCLYIGGGNGKAVPPGAVPAGATSYFDVVGTDLFASDGTGTLDCTKGAGPGKVCLNNDALPACTSDANCGGTTNACFPKANCFFGPPLEFPNPVLTGLTTCALNVFRLDASGTADASTGDSSAMLPLASEVYTTGNVASPCPHCCVPPPGGSCTGTCSYGANAAGACTSTSSSGTSQDCPPERGLASFAAPLGVTLSPLTTDSVSLTSSSGNFCTAKTCADTGVPCSTDNDCTCLNPPVCSNRSSCAAQRTAGAFGIGSARCIKQTGAPGGDLTDGMPHASILASVFCIPRTTNSAIDGIADLPGPGSTSIPGLAQLIVVGTTTTTTAAVATTTTVASTTTTTGAATTTTSTLLPPCGSAIWPTCLGTCASGTCLPNPDLSMTCLCQ